MLPHFKYHIVVLNPDTALEYSDIKPFDILCKLASMSLRERLAGGARPPKGISDGARWYLFPFLFHQDMWSEPGLVFTKNPRVLY